MTCVSKVNCQEDKINSVSLIIQTQKRFPGSLDKKVFYLDDYLSYQAENVLVN